MRGVVWSERTQARFAQGFADPWSDLRIGRFVLSIPQWIVQRRGERAALLRVAAGVAALTVAAGVAVTGSRGVGAALAMVRTAADKQ